MKFVQCTVEELGLLRRYADNHRILTEFVESGLSVARVEDWPQASAEICYTSLRASVKRYKFNQVKVSVRNGKVYLIRKDI